MTGHLWANRLVVGVCGLLLGASLLFASAWRAAMTPWSPAAPPRMAAANAPLAGATAPPPDLFHDDFARDALGANPPAGWTIADGLWAGVTSDQGRVVRHAAGPSYGHLVAGSADWTDYSVTARMRLTPLSTGFAGVAARYRDRGDYYACGVYYASAVRLWRVRGGIVTLLDARRQAVATDRFHDVRLVVKGSHLSCVFDDTTVLTGTDATFPSGRIALMAGNDETAEFANIVVGT
jgi:pectate lyase